MTDEEELLPIPKHVEQQYGYLPDDYDEQLQERIKKFRPYTPEEAAALVDMPVPEDPELAAELAECITAEAVECGERYVVLTRYLFKAEWDMWAAALPEECLEGHLTPAELKEAGVERELLVNELTPEELEEYDKA